MSAVPPRGISSSLPPLNISSYLFRELGRGMMGGLTAPSCSSSSGVRTDNASGQLLSELLLLSLLCLETTGGMSSSSAVSLSLPSVPGLPTPTCGRPMTRGSMDSSPTEMVSGGRVTLEARLGPGLEWERVGGWSSCDWGTGMEISLGGDSVDSIRLLLKERERICWTSPRLSLCVSRICFNISLRCSMMSVRS